MDLTCDLTTGQTISCDLHMEPGSGDIYRNSYGLANKFVVAQEPPYYNSSQLLPYLLSGLQVFWDIYLMMFVLLGLDSLLESVVRMRLRAGLQAYDHNIVRLWLIWHAGLAEYLWRLVIILPVV